MKTNANTINALNDLLKKLMESEYNYMNCVNQVFHRGVRNFVVTQTQTKNTFVHQLALEIQKMGGEIYLFEAESVVPFSFYEDLRTIDFLKMLDLCVASEKELIDFYDAILNEHDLEETTAYLLTKQKTELLTLLSEEKLKLFRTHERLVS